MTNLYGTNVAGGIYPFTTDDDFETHDATYGKGGIRSVTDITARDLITTKRRSEGMLVYVISENIIYLLFGGITNSDWIQLSSLMTGIAGENIIKGQPLYINTDNKIYIAENTTFNSSKVIGFALRDVSEGGLCLYLKDVIMMLDWTDISGTEFLTIGDIYFLSTTGTITNTPPIGGYSVNVGKAISATKLQIDIGLPYLV